jgi:nitrate/TMAO reductase-like tetraheme cytochrome c subunit
MKKPRFTSPINPAIAGILAVLFLLVSTSLMQAQQIASRPLTPREIDLNNLPDGTVTSGGLLVVGLGEPVYLEVQVPTGTVVSSVTWNVAERPLGGSTANLEDSPIPSSMPIFSPGDRAVLEVAGRKMFIPDVEGKYLITADVNTDGGLLNLEAVVAGAIYVGVGTIDGTSPVYPQCGLCHPENTLTYMATGHAGALEDQITGMGSSHFNESCLSCHSLGKGYGYDNGSFFSVAEDVGWTFPEELVPENWTNMALEQKAMAGVQCEHCHGAGSVHHGDVEGTAVSLSSGDCGQCHDADPYHKINAEWNLSRHSIATRYPTGPGRGSCVECHSGIGFIEEMDGVAEKSTDYEAIVCAACHDPHSAENESQLRTLADVELENGHMVTQGGTGMLCMNCHKSRRDAESYVQGNVSSHFGPHYGIQGDLFHGTNAIEYGKVSSRASGHLYGTENSCATCHMNVGDLGDAPANSAGGHTFRVVSENGTPDDHSDDIDMVSGCVECHGPMDSFDYFKADYNLDGIAEPIQTEVHHLLEALALLLPPVGEPEAHPNPDLEYTDAQKKALYNYLCAEEDGSFGMHNPKYITGILKASIEDLSDPFNALFSGINVPVGGEWFYSTWFDFYSPQEEAGWIYHFEHGHLFVQGVPGLIWIFEDRTQTWRYTSEDLYPIMYSPNTGWVYYAGVRGFDRMFYSYATGEWSFFE